MATQSSPLTFLDPADPNTAVVVRQYYTQLARVCLDYSYAIRRTEFLFGPVYTAFADAGQSGAHARTRVCVCVFLMGRS